MTRKDYLVIAAALLAAKPVDNLGACVQWINDCREIASAFACDNNRFDRDRFFTACGLESV